MNKILEEFSLGLFLWQLLLVVTLLAFLIGFIYILKMLWKRTKMTVEDIDDIIEDYTRKDDE